MTFGFYKQESRFLQSMAILKVINNQEKNFFTQKNTFILPIFTQNFVGIIKKEGRLPTVAVAA